MRRRALLSTGAAVAAALAGRSTRSEDSAAEAVDGAELTPRHEHTGAFEPDALSLRLTTEDRPNWEGDVCDDVAEPHFHEVAVTFTEAPVSDRVVVRHGDETVLEGTV